MRNSSFSILENALSCVENYFYNILVHTAHLYSDQSTAYIYLYALKHGETHYVGINIFFNNNNVILKIRYK